MGRAKQRAATLVTPSQVTAEIALLAGKRASPPR